MVIFKNEAEIEIDGHNITLAFVTTVLRDRTLRRKTVRRWTVRLRTVRWNIPKSMDSTAELHDTHIKTITIDGAEQDTCFKCSNPEK